MILGDCCSCSSFEPSVGEYFVFRMGSHASGNDYKNAKVTFLGHIVGKDGQYGRDGTRVLRVRCKPWVQIIKQA